MSKILAVADIHIHDYPHRNPNGDSCYRLHQGSRTVAQNIIKAGQECEYIVMAGDIIEKSILRPYVISEVYAFLHEVMKHFKEGWIIWGNHDMDNKSSDQDIYDSCLGVILPENLHYAHQKIINIDGTTIGFNNWQPEFDLSWIPGKVDILFTHARICYAGGKEIFQSQVLDESKFDLAFCGDIHKPAQQGKYVSIGIPQRCKMTDSEVCTGVLLDCSQKSWKYVNLNPDDNLMKFTYTNDPEDEGWDSTNGVWKVFKRDTSNTVDPGTGVVVSEWEKIESLVNEAIVKAGLEKVHTQVLSGIKDLDAGEVDFNFSLVKFYCKNWRSIDEVTMYFDEGDKILLVGENGAGKSSLLSAIKYAFCDCKIGGMQSLKSFIQFGTKKCVTEVEFFYQGNRYRLRRGTESKDCGLWINEVPQKYNCKADFSKDCDRRFPFTRYIDVMIHDQDHNQFIGSKSGEWLAEIISKTFKLDRIDTYHDTAMMLLKNIQSESAAHLGKIKEAQRLLDFVNSKLSMLQVPPYSKEELQYRRAEGLEMQRKNNEWNLYLTRSSRLQATIDKLREDIAKEEQQLSSLRGREEIEQEISGLDQRIKDLQQKMIGLGSIRDKVELKRAELERLGNEGSALKASWQSIEPEKVSSCPTCGQIVHPSPERIAMMTEKKNKLYQELQEKAVNYKKLQGELGELTRMMNNTAGEYNNLSAEIQSLNTRIHQCVSEKQRGLDGEHRIGVMKNQLSAAESELASSGIPQRVDLPEGFMQKMSEIETGLRDWETWESSMSDKARFESEISKEEAELNGISEVIEQIENYIKLTGPTGIIYKEVMEKLVAQFNDNLVNYEVSLQEYRGKQHLTLTPQYYNNGNWISYTACSGGQKTVLDIHFLSKIISRTGLLIFDEFLKHLDPANHDLCVDMISNMNIGCTFISSHMESIQAFNNKTCKLSLNGSGLTKIDFS